MHRVALSKEENRRVKALRRAGLSGKISLDDFADEVGDLVNIARGMEGHDDKRGGKASGLSDLFARQRVSQKFGGEPEVKKARGGDDDLPRRESLSQRRAKYDAVVARRGGGAGGDDDDDDDDMDGGGGGGGGSRKRQRGEEDEFYAAAKAASTARKAARKEAHTAPALPPPLPDDVAPGARRITNDIQKNRGLTPHRYVVGRRCVLSLCLSHLLPATAGVRPHHTSMAILGRHADSLLSFPLPRRSKEMRNPRKAQRIKFERALVRRQGQVQAVRQPEERYGGEATGIKANVTKSRKLG